MLHRRRQAPEPVGNALSAYIPNFDSIGITDRMNGWGIGLCAGQYRGDITGAIAANKDILISALQSHGLPTSDLQIGAETLLDKALDDMRGRKDPNSIGSAINLLNERQEKVRRSAVNALTVGMRPATDEQQAYRLSICDTCPLLHNGVCMMELGGFGFPVREKVKPAEAVCPQGKWFDHNERYAPLVNPTRNMIFYIFPKKGAEWNWKWHIQQIHRVKHHFNGKIAIGIATGSNLAPVSTVQALLSGVPVTHWITRPNNVALGETPTFTELLECVESDDPNAVTFRGHCKGVSYKRDNIAQPWARAMWASCMDLQSVDDALASHIMAGPMKCHEPLVSTQRYRWFFAGTFFWFRNREIFQRDWREMEQTRWYPEAWPGVLCTNEESASLFHDFTCGSTLRENYWRKVVDPDFAQWKFARPNRDKRLE